MIYQSLTLLLAMMRTLRDELECREWFRRTGRRHVAVGQRLGK